MTRYSEGLYGSFLYGETTYEHPIYALVVDWDGDQAFDGVNEATDRITDMSIERGRRYFIDANGETFEEESTGRFSVTLLDEERRYDMYNGSSPLYGQLGAGKLFKMQVVTSSGKKDLMAGILDEPVSFSERGMVHAKLSGVDGWGLLRDQNNQVTIPLQEDIYVDTAMGLILSAAGWPSGWGSNLDEGVDLRPFYWVDARSPARAIHELAFNELGKVNITGDGMMRFRSRLAQESEVLVLGDDDFMNMQRMTPQEVIRNVLKVRSAPRVEGSTSEVWRLGGELEIGAGETINDIWAEFTYNSVTVPVKSPITPAASTDYTAFSGTGGAGSNLTSDISVSMYPFSTRAKLTVTNNGASTAYVNLLRVRGNPLTAQNQSTFEYTDTASVQQFGARTFTLTIDQDVNTARVYREILASTLVDAKNYLVVDLVPEPDIQFGVDLGEVVSVQSDAYGIDGSFRVIHVSHKFADKKGIVVNTRWHLEPFERLFTGVQLPFQLPVQLGSV